MSPDAPNPEPRLPARSATTDAPGVPAGAADAGGSAPTEAARLAALRRYKVLDTPDEEAFDRIVRLACAMFGTPIAEVSLVDEWRQWIKARVPDGPREAPRSWSFCSAAIQGSTVMVVPDAQEDERVKQSPFVTGYPGIRFYAGAPLRTPDGHNLGTLCIVSPEPRAGFGPEEQQKLQALADIVVSELELRRRRREDVEMLNKLLESSSDCIKILGLDGDLQFMNGGEQALMEVEDFRACQGRPWPGLWMGEAREKLLGALATARAGRTGRFEGQAATLRGTPRWWEVTVNPILGEDGKPERLLAISRDITERKEAEAALARAAEDFRTLADNISQLAWMTEPDGWISWYNRRWFDYTGTTLEEMQGWGWRAVHHPDHVERVVAKISRAFETGEAWEDTFPLRGKDGQYRWFLSRALPIRDGAGRILRWFGTNTDVTALREAEAALAEREGELRRLNETLESRVAEEVAAREAVQARLAHAQRMEALGQLAGGIAHDFNNVLQAIQGGAGLMRRRASDPRTVDHLARMVEEAAGRGAAVTRRLLAFARRGELRTEAVDPAALLGGVQEVLEHTLGVGITVRAEGLDGPPLPPLLADKGGLETVLVNLAANARDAMPRGGTLTLSAAEEQAGGQPAHPLGLPPGRYVRLSVSDTGEGMTADVLARASEPFFTTKPQGKGTGLGLAMARGFAEQLGGAFTMRSTPGAGTTVTLWLPVAPEASPGKAGNAGAVRRAEAARVLVVDDEDLVREVLAEGLEEHGYAALRAGSAAAALAVLDAGEAVDVLLTDYAMPGTDGLSLIGEARRRKPGLAAVLLTGNVNGEVEARLALDGMTGGAFSLLRKPVMADELARRIEALLERAKQA